MSPLRKFPVLALAVTSLGVGLGFPPAHAADAPRTDANRFTYLEESDPFYVGLTFPKLLTPQWIGEPGVEAVVILAVDDMRETAPYEKFLRPILDRLKQIDGRAPVSIMVNGLNPTNSQLQSWLKEGLSLEVHTLAHPCPLCARSNFVAAAETYHGCVDLLNQVPGNKPVAFRMPCCDSMNSPSPRFYAEMFNRTTPNGHFLLIDSSVMNIITPQDRALPRELVLDADGRERFRKYLPATTNAITRVSMGSFVTTIEDYPYPYVIGKRCWEFPCMVPSDWEANNLHKPNNPVTVADWEAALEATVRKQGAFTFIFHPHGWIRSEQMVEFINHATQRYGKKVKFLNFREAQERLDKHLLAGNPLRAPDGGDNGVRLLDLNGDGYLDVVIGNAQVRKTRVWNPAQTAWADMAFPTEVAGVQFGLVQPEGHAIALKVGRSPSAGAWHFDGSQWAEDKSLLNGLTLDSQPILTHDGARDRGARFRDMDRDGRCELLVGNDTQNAVFAWSGAEKSWKKLSYALPKGTAIVDGQGQDAGLRFIDVNEDGYDDVLFSDGKVFSLHQFVPKANPRLSWPVGWSDEVVTGQRDKANAKAESPSRSGEIPMIVRSGPQPNNGAWFRSGFLWVQNEETAHLPDKVDRRSFKQLLTADQPPPLSPDQSLAAIQVRAGFKVELVASEPLVTDPIAFDWSADGKFWVVEMGDYPLGLDGKGQPGGQIKFLEDTNADGRYDKATVFLDGLNFPTGLIPWRQGLIVSAAPEIFYAEDTDGDGKADVRRTLFTGFKEGNQQHRLNGFDYGLDNWLYGANGDSGGEVESKILNSKSKISISSRDFRFRPDTGEFEAIAGMTQFGRHRDDWGNWFGNDNPVWLWHFHLPDHYLARNPHLAVKTTKQMLANYPVSTRCYPSSRTPQRFNDPWQRHHVTSGNSPTPYRDELFGPDFAGSVFVSEPVHNLIHREVLQPDGVSFKSHRATDEQESEFLRSKDNWFRPIMLKTGPEGALYIADMYRLVLEHPEWITPAQQQRLDLRAGADQGRIYRVYPEGAALRQFPRLDTLDTAGLVAALDNPNGWQRDTVQRLLVQSGDKSAVAPLEKLLASSARPKVRLQALGTLDGLNALRPEILLTSLKDAHFAVREHAIRLSEAWLTRRTQPETGATPVLPFAEPLLGLTDDPSPRVRYQLAFSLGEWNDPRAAQALAKLAVKDRDNAPLQIAVLSSAPRHIGPLLTAVLAESRVQPSATAPLEKLLGLATALGNDAAISDALARLAPPAGRPAAGWQFAVLASFLDALERRDLTLEEFCKRGGQKQTFQEMELLFAQARTAAGATGAPETDRLAAIKVLARTADHKEADLQQLAALLHPQNPVALQQAALSRLGQEKGEAIAAILLEGWHSYGPALRNDTVTLLLTRKDWSRKLIQEIEQGRLSPAHLSTAQQQKLLKHSDESMRERAAKVLSATRADRQALLKDYAEVAQLKGDPAKGAALYRQNCATCHRLRGEGQDVGPELGAVANKPLDALLVAILDPNQAVEWRYSSYTALTRNDREINGLIVAETPTSITVRAPGGVEETILRTDLKNLKHSDLSLMPEGFETVLKPQDMADLLVFIAGQ